MDPTDHNLVFSPFIASEDADTLDVLFWGEEDQLERECNLSRELTKYINGLDSLFRSMASIWRWANGTQVGPELQPILSPRSHVHVNISAIDSGIKIRPNEDDLKAMPEFQERWKGYFQNSPDKPVMAIGPLAA
jgi:alcohol oxidase